MIAKLLALFVVAFLVVSPSYADVYMSWRTGGGFILGDTVGGTLPTTPNSIMAAGSADSILLQFIWTPYNYTQDANIGDANFLGTDEVLLSSLVFTEANTTATRFGSTPLATVTSAQAPGGYVYGRVFDTSTPGVGTWYYEGNVVAANYQDMSVTPLPTAPEYQIVRNPSEYTVGATRIESINMGANSFQIQPVPEPGTMALFALGVATLAAARRRKVAKV